MKIISLTKGQQAIVDDADYEWLSRFKWSAVSNPTYGFYAVRYERESGVRKVILMHRVIMQAADDFEIDHRNGNTLDNQRANLRVATRAENAQNRSKFKNNTTGYKGVCKDKRNGRFRADIRCKGVKYSLGYFPTAIDAARAYDAAAMRMHGEFAVCNNA